MAAGLRWIYVADDPIGRSLFIFYFTSSSDETTMHIIILEGACDRQNAPKWEVDLL